MVSVSTLDDEFDIQCHSQTLQNLFKTSSTKKILERMENTWLNYSINKGAMLKLDTLLIAISCVQKVEIELVAFALSLKIKH